MNLALMLENLWLPLIGSNCLVSLKEVVPDSTEVNPDKNFNAWADWGCAAERNDTVPSDIVIRRCCCSQQMAMLYIIKKDSESYPSTSLNLLLCGLNAA